MRLTERQLNRATLDRQLLLRRAPVDVPTAVSRVVALQAQEPASPYVALWNRVADLDAANVDAAFAERRLVKATLMRITLHVVHHDDWAAFHGAMLPTLRAGRLLDRRYRSVGLSIADADALLDELAAFTDQPRAAAEIEQMLAAAVGEGASRMWWALRTFARLHHVPTGGPWSFGRPSTFVAVDGTAPVTHEHGVLRLLVRYLQGFGPATAKDVARFTLLRRGVVQQALEAARDRVEILEGPDGAALYDVPGAPRPPEDTPAPPRLLPMWDSTLLAYDDRARMVPDAYRTFVFRRNGDVLPTLLVDGYVAGVWRPVDGGIEASTFRGLDAATWAALAEEAQGLWAFLADRDPATYGRYDHWWDKGLPAVEVRRLPG